MFSIKSAPSLISSVDVANWVFLTGGFLLPGRPTIKIESGSLSHCGVLQRSPACAAFFYDPRLIWMVFTDPTIKKPALGGLFFGGLSPFFSDALNLTNGLCYL
jgi:hypothetical protein